MAEKHLRSEGVPVADWPGRRFRWAENLTDSVLAPVAFYLAFGLPGAFAYRAVNTADSMIGYRHGALEHFGLRSFPKTSGALGLHVLVPIERRHTYDDTRRFATEVAQAIAGRHADLATTGLP